MGAVVNVNQRGRPAGGWARGGLMLLVGLALLGLPGCGGCQKSATPTEEEKKAEEQARKEKPKPPLQTGGLRLRPYGNQAFAQRGAEVVGCKPGHWTSATLPEAKANHENFHGALEVWPTDRKLNPVTLEGMPYELTVAREVTLPKGQPKQLESALLVPPHRDAASASFRLTTRQGSRGELENSIGVGRMPSYQYHFVVLARWPDRYKYLDVLDAVSPRGELGDGTKPYHRLSLMNVVKSGERLMLPSHATCWTSIAVLLWDDADPAWLEPDQKTALLDWLHWGGQLIVSGPETLDTLRDSFLWPYLPAVNAASWEIGADDVRPLNRWQVGSRALAPAKPWTGVRLKLADAPETRFVPGAGELLAERRVGRGRVVVSAFRLSGRDLTDWPGCDSFFNSCLLARPARRFIDRQGDWVAEWESPGERLHRLDAALISNVRYFTRDTGVPMSSYGADALHAADTGALEESPPATGVAAWNDFNPVAERAREALAIASRIEIPDRNFVLWVVAAYLAVLVPLNWILFWLMGRVEWAWAAAPLVAVVCTAVVIRAAQLDIGFVRARTEVAVLEVQGDYPRAHLTRYAALYTSLTTGYRFELDDPGGVVQPFPEADTRQEPSRFLAGKTKLRLDRGEAVELSGFSIDSASCKYVHSEQMLDLVGPLRLVENADGGLELHNEAGLKLHGAGLVRRDPEGKLQSAWLGDLEPGAKARVVWSWDAPPETGREKPDHTPGEGADAGARSLWEAERSATAATAPRGAAGELSLRRLVALAEQTVALEKDQTRLIAWCPGEVPGMRIAPRAPQARFGTLVVAHLRYGFARDPQPDVNLRPKGKQEDAPP